MHDYLRRAWAEISLDRLNENITHLKELSHGTRICAVVKANAYGHDDRSIAPFLEEQGISFFAVSNVKEAVNLRECGVSGEILILGHTPVEYADVLSHNDIIQCAVSADYARSLDEAAKEAGCTVKIHLAIDTGMGRIGALPEIAVSEIKTAASLENVHLDGIFTHFAAADSYDEDDIRYTEEQKRVFFDIADKAREQGVALRCVHCMNSAGGVFHYDSRSSLIRDGILLYGLKPDVSLDIPFELSPVMELKAAVSYVKTVPAGTSVSYGRTYRTTGERRIATVPIGYADGFPRSLSGKGEVLVCGKRAPIVGRICMDQLMIDVTDIPDVREGTVVTLIGTDGSETMTADDIAQLTGTIGYEIVCGISKRVPRVIFRNGDIVSIREYY